MNKAAAHPTPNKELHENTPNAEPAILLAGSFGLQILDTTWRIAVPVLIFVAVGLFGDVHLHTKPWLTLAGTALGFVLAAFLIKKRIEDVNRRHPDVSATPTPKVKRDHV